MSDEVRCYAKRRLNPFLGVLQIVETTNGRASTANGLVWHIEVLVEKPKGWGSLGSINEGKAWSLYGLWSEADGLVESPSGARIIGKQAAQDAKHLIEALKLHQSELPFALADRRELWLLDAQQKKPLVLLFSMLPEAKRPRPEPRYWKGCLGRGTAGQFRFPEIDRLEMQVRKRVSFNIERLWVTWDSEHKAVVSDDGKPLAGEEFPVFGIREDWDDQTDQQRVASYIDWISPAQLTLPYLDDERRSRLETRLAKQAVSVEYHWRLYPKILDASKLKAVRVQAKLQRSGLIVS